MMLNDVKYRPAGIPARCRLELFDELVGIKLVHGRLALDDALGEIEVLQIGEAFHIDLAELFLAGIDQRGIVIESRLHRAFLAFPSGTKLTKSSAALLGSSMMSFM